jgi:hypothetical protein
MKKSSNFLAKAKNKFHRLGLKSDPFTESRSITDGSINNVFTGRDAELEQVAQRLLGEERRRILVYGRIGIGKSAFLAKILTDLEEYTSDLLVVRATLQENQDLAEAALIELARAMPDNELAKRQLYALGILQRQAPKKLKSEAGANLIASGKFTEEDNPIPELKNPAINLNILIEEAKKQYAGGVLIAIDDLDKQDPKRVRDLMHNAQGMLKGSAWYILTGHPTGITHDLLTTERGLFDLRLELKELDPDTRYQMLVNYLNSVRIDNDCDDPDNPRSVLPFLPDTAKRLCDESRGRPRLFNRLGSAVLNAALKEVDNHLDGEAIYITHEVLEAGLREAYSNFREQAALKMQTQRVLGLLERKGGLSDESITLEELHSIGFSSFNEIVPFLERLQDADLAYRRDLEDATEYEAILPPGSVEALAKLPPSADSSD